jgi:hypothetical protein
VGGVLGVWVAGEVVSAGGGVGTTTVSVCCVLLLPPKRLWNASFTVLIASPTREVASLVTGTPADDVAIPTEEDESPTTGVEELLSVEVAVEEL